MSIVVTSFIIAASNTPQKADASFKASDFDAGRIIDDAVFYNSNAMTASQIQAFLNSKVNCDTNGAGMATDWNRGDISRATLASYIRNGTNGYKQNTNFHAPPYTCLRDFKQNTPQVEAASGYCAAISAKANSSAAQIISDVGIACGINPQVLLVLLEKEQSLVTDIWPLNHQYNRATGFACPDNVGGACDPQFNGFFRQVYAAARQFKVYQAHPNSYNYVAGRINNILWQVAVPGVANFHNSNGSPANAQNGHCGYSQVHIQNQATAALYIYTPYRPNSAALSNYPGVGDGCSAYGNRNFFAMFTNWFGNPKKPNLPSCTLNNLDCVYGFINEDTGQSFYTASTLERDQVYKGNFTFTGIAFSSRKPNTKNSVNVMRLYNTKSNFHLWTASINERDNLMKQGGWSDEGVKFYVDPTDANSGNEVTRLYTQNGNGRHIFTANKDEISSLTKQGFRNEGVVFKSSSTAADTPIPSAGSNNVYRFYFGDRHFWTTSLNERDQLIKQKFNYEGVSWETPREGSVPVYRVYSPTGYHFWTTSENEKDNLVRSGWKNEGISWSTVTEGKATYRLYNTRTGVHLFTTSEPERKTLITSKLWRDEGVAWYQ